MGQIQRLVSGLFAAPIQSHTLWGLDIQTSPQESFISILTCGHCPKHHVYHVFTGQSEFHFGAQNHTFSCYNSGGGIRHFSLPQAIKTKTPQLVWGTGPVWGLPRVGREELWGPTSVVWLPLIAEEHRGSPASPSLPPSAVMAASFTCTPWAAEWQISVPVSPSLCHYSSSKHTFPSDVFQALFLLVTNRNIQ